MKFYEYLLKEGVSVEKRSDKTFFVSKKNFLVKQQLPSEPRKQFVQFEEIPNIELLTERHTIFFKDEHYEIYRINSGLNHGNIKSFRQLINLYSHSDKIKVFSDFYSIGDMFHVAHTHIGHFGVSLGDVVEKFKKRTKSMSAEISGCKKGFFHGDMHFGNLLTDENEKLYLVDLDWVKNSYVILNLAQLFYIELFKHKTTLEKLSEEREYVLKNVSEADAKSFDFFVLLSGFNWTVRTLPFQEPDIKKRKLVLNQRLEEQFNFMQKLKKN